jgi:UDP-N-acetylmuramate--alanine ligase
VKKAFADFLHRLPFYGVAVLCVDDPNVAELARDTARRTLTYAIDAAADVRASDVRQDGARMHFDLHLPGATALAVTLNAPGLHNVRNALAAAAVGWQLGVAADAIARAFANFQGVGRRFQARGEILIDSGKVLLVDDYGHHPR